MSLRTALPIAAGLAVLAPVIGFGSIPAGVDRQVTGSIPRNAAMVRAPMPADEALAGALSALDAGDIASARQARDVLPAYSLDRRLLVWAIATDDHPAVTTGEIEDASRLLADWPGVGTLRRNAEAALLRQNPSADRVTDFFAGRQPATTAGKRALARAMLARGERDAAKGLVKDLWRSARMGAGEESSVLAEFGGMLDTSDHRHRMEAMLYAERSRDALRAARLAEAEEMAKAWIAVNGNAATAAKLLDAVPQTQRGAGWTFAKARQLRRSGEYREAAAMMRTAPTTADLLVDPDAWWIERRVLSRELLDLGEAKGAYDIAAAHAAESPPDFADAEFHAGWYALRFLNDPMRAAAHFKRIVEIADGAISLARGHYWLGRAAEVSGDPAAPSHFQRAASYGTAFYGQLAAARLGRAGIAIGTPDASEAERTAFEARDAVRALRRLEELGLNGRAARLYRDLAQHLDNTGELALLVGMAEQRGDHYLALRLGKLASARGLATGALAWPTGAIPSDAGIDGAGKALAYAIARQESEFRTTAVSKAGALGLLQLMPGTAREMASKANLPFAVHRLTGDAGYNATLGATFLSEQLDSFSGSYVMTFAGYNAGPRRAREWAARYGDPRGMELDDVVDWMERIPYHETRAYVQRVMENYQVYKMRLTGRFSIASDLTQGRKS